MLQNVRPNFYKNFFKNPDLEEYLPHHAYTKTKKCALLPKRSYSIFYGLALSLIIEKL